MAAIEAEIDAARTAGSPLAEADALERYLSLRGDDATAHYRIGRIYNEQKRYPQAVPHLRRALDLLGRDRDAARGLALAYENMGQFGAAIEILTELKAFRDDPYAGVRLGWLHLVRGELEASQREFDEVLELWPTDDGVRIGLGALRRASGDLPGSLEILEEARSFRTVDPQLNYQLALTYGALGRSADAQRAMAAFEAGSR